MRLITVFNIPSFWLCLLFNFNYIRDNYKRSILQYTMLHQSIKFFMKREFAVFIEVSFSTPINSERLYCLSALRKYFLKYPSYSFFMTNCLLLKVTVFLCFAFHYSIQYTSLYMNNPSCILWSNIIGTKTPLSCIQCLLA